MIEFRLSFLLGKCATEMLKVERNKSFHTQVDPKLTLEEGLKWLKILVLFILFSY